MKSLREEGSEVRVFDNSFFATCADILEPGPRGVVFLEPQPFLQCHPSAPKTQWVMVIAHGYRPYGWLERLRLLWGRFKGKSAVGRMSSFPVADSQQTTSLGLSLNSLWLRLKACIEKKARH